MAVSTRRMPRLKLGPLVSEICERYPEEVQMYLEGKSCVGFLVTQVLHHLGNLDVKKAHEAVIAELERRKKIADDSTL
jgi:hypothetical protein